MHAQFAVEELVVSDLIFKQAKLQGKYFYSEINLLMFPTRIIFVHYHVININKWSQCV